MAITVVITPDTPSITTTPPKNRNSASRFMRLAFSFSYYFTVFLKARRQKCDCCLKHIYVRLVMTNAPKHRLQYLSKNNAIKTKRNPTMEVQSSPTVGFLLFKFGDGFYFSSSKAFFIFSISLLLS